MYYSLLSALLLASHIAADNTFNASATPTLATAPPAIPPAANGTATNTTAPTPIQANCTSLYLTFSERDIAEMSDLESGNTTSQADLAKLSDDKEAALCQSPQLNALCSTSSCSPTPPVCQQCFTFTPDANSDTGTVGNSSTPTVTCSDNYNFNSTNTITPHLCGFGGQEYSCQSCAGAISCTTCYNTNDIPNA